MSFGACIPPGSEAVSTETMDICAESQAHSLVAMQAEVDWCHWLWLNFSRACLVAHNVPVTFRAALAKQITSF